MITLLILDGWGYRTEKKGNAILEAATPFFDKLNEECTPSLLEASGTPVGLLDGQMGNSEVGHLNIGAGRTVFQELPRIFNAIEDGSFFENPSFKEAINQCLAKDSALHLIGLLSDGGVHSHEKHLYGLMELAKKRGVKRLFLHPLFDGRDTPPQSSHVYLKRLIDKIEELEIGQIATIMGRYYGMDRDQRWERTEMAYRALVRGEGIQGESPMDLLESSYKAGINDEFVKPSVIIDKVGKPLGSIGQEDSIIFFNFRSDRIRQITRSFFQKNFEGFDRGDEAPLPFIVCLTEYDQRFNLPVAFPPATLKNTLGKVLSDRGLRQLRTAETEKYAHVTFFFNGGAEDPYEGEERSLIPSPKVATYDLKPEMSVEEVKRGVLAALESEAYEFVVVNLANPDMVGHTGVYDAALEAVQAIDKNVCEIVEAVKKAQGTILITADHGNIEEMINEEGGPITAHSTNPVPLYCLSSNRSYSLREKGKLADIGPTILELFGIDQPEEMTGQSLLLSP